MVPEVGWGRLPRLNGVETEDGGSVTPQMSVRMRIAMLAAVVSAGMPAAPTAGQEAGARRTGAVVISPEVAADRRVTFRLPAPDAKAVTVSGDFGPHTALRKGDDGVWCATIGPLDSEMYVYYFTVDGIRLTDPNNPQVKIGYVTTTTTSLLAVPSPQPALYDVQDVPHGEIRTLLYRSKSNGVTRELNVYVPPGYDQARGRRYPVLYLLHGFANDHHSWHRYGRANDILDNLLAERKIVVGERPQRGR